MLGLTLGASQFTNHGTKVRALNTGKTSSRQCKDVGRVWSNVHILAIVATKQGDDLSLEATTTPLRVDGDLVPKSGRKTDRSRDGGFTGES